MNINIFRFSLMVCCLLGLQYCSTDDEAVTPMTENSTPTVMEPDSTETITNPPPTGPRVYERVTYKVAEISIDVYLPSDYDPGRRYKTLYFNDGDSFADIFGSLTSLSDLDPFILVGLGSELSRSERFSAYLDDRLTTNYGTYVPMADDYSRMIAEEVIPFLKSEYNMGQSALFGISLGGLHAAWMGMNYPDAFSFYGALSPAFWVADRAIFGESVEKLRPTGALQAPKKFYFDRGTAEWRNFLPFVDQLQQVGLEYGKDIFYYEVEGADHDQSYWLARIEIPFRLFMEGISGSELTDLVVRSYCPSDLDADGALTSRLNPLAYYANGVVLSVISKAEVKVVSGSGKVEKDGTYTINSGTSLDVEVSFGGITEQVTLKKCN